MNSIIFALFALASVAIAIDINQLSSEVVSLRTAAAAAPVPLLNLIGGWKFDVSFDIRLAENNWEDSTNPDSWTIHGIWEAPGCASSRDHGVITYASEWGAAVREYNTDMTNAHRRLKPLTTVAANTFPIILLNPANARINGPEYMSGMFAHEYRTHGYYLPMSKAQYEAVIMSAQFTELKAICARHAAALLAKGSPITDKTNFKLDVYDAESTTSVNLKLLSNTNNGSRFVDCLAGATVSFKKIPGQTATATLAPTVHLHTAVRQGKHLYVRNALWKDKN